MADDKKQELLRFLEERAFNPVLRAKTSGRPEADQRKLEHVQRATRAEIERFRIRNPSANAEDHDGIPVFLARNAWDLRTTIEEWPQIRFTETREQS